MTGPPTDEMAAARERLVTLTVNEAALCLQEGLVENADALDLALVLGAGWARIGGDRYIMPGSAASRTLWRRWNDWPANWDASSRAALREFGN